MSAQKNKARKQRKTKDTLVYCGPSLKGLSTFAVFKGDTPKHVQAHMKNSPAVKELMVSSDQVKHVNQNVATRGSREYQLYQSALAYAEGGKS